MSNTKLNALALYANFIVLALIGLIINPQLVRALGAEHFGIWKACLRILDLSSAADGRGTQALKWIVARQAATGETEQKQRDVGAAIVIWLIWLPILLIAITASIIALPTLIAGIAPIELATVRFAAALLGVNVLLAALLGVPDAVLAGTNQGYRSYVVTTLFLVFSNVAMVVAAFCGAGLIGLGVATLAGTLLGGLTTYTIARRRVSWWGIRRPAWSDVRRTLGFSNWTLVWSLVQMLLLSSEVLLIGYFSGAVDVSRYTFTAYVSQFAVAICLMTGSAVTPRLGALIGADDAQTAARLYDQTRQFLLTIVAVIGSGILVSNRAFVTLWVGDTFYLGDATTLVMVAVLAQLALIRFEAQVQDVGLRIGGKVLWGSAGVVVSFVLAGVLYRVTGDLALMLVGLIIGRLPLNFIFPRQVGRLIPDRGRGVRGDLGCAAILIGAYGLSRIWPVQGYLGFGLSLVVGPVLSGAVAWFVILSPSQRSQMIAGFMRMRGR
jgi:O-antigen/teichoic acid export membrane protein